MPLSRRFAFSRAPFLGRNAATFVLFIGVLMFVAGPLARPAMTQSADMGQLIQRMERIEADMQDLLREVLGSKDGRSISARPAPQGGSGASEVRFSEIEAAMSDLTAAVEVMGHQVDVLENRFDKLVGDIDFRLSQIERSVASIAGGAQRAPTATPAAPAPGSPTETAPAAPAPEEQTGSRGVLPDGTPQERYAFARTLLTRLDYDAAEVAFAEFLVEHQDHPLAGNAQYWLGETYYVRQKYPEAATAFIEGYQKFPEGSKAPDNLLKLGMSLAALDQKSDACATFAELLSRFEDADDNITRRAIQEQTRLRC